ncbi:hypothetical protein JOY44_18455 [Phormidium sp. CLA17]|uniref:hypothetical protein n=1 Tax=Leptolyngbya sp. Cla-17 TaxID=2803751 RepID=UPI001490CA64|nr:hypothetical protein [Leptolyngbya sp. Cla-17]MBM0743570.1 hypothetical protein [Leptolyngbya sp. Cla-17]
MVLKYRIRLGQLPLAVYREVAAHLRQVEGVQTELVPQTSQQFDYTLSQIDSLWIHYPDDISTAERVKQILAYYSDRYGAWETVETVTATHEPSPT